MIDPKRGYMADGIENVIALFYSKGMSNSDIEKQIREVYNLKFLLPTFSGLPKR